MGYVFEYLTLVYLVMMQYIYVCCKRNVIDLVCSFLFDYDYGQQNDSHRSRMRTTSSITLRVCKLLQILPFS